MLHRLENGLRPWVSFLILPVFAFVNAGFHFYDLSLNMLASPIVLGVVLGLFLGKQMGVMSFAWILIKLKAAKLPKQSSWLAFYGVSLLCGIGFTMSLFLGTLSFPNQGVYLPEVRLGVILGSLLSAISGVLILKHAFKKQTNFKI